MSALMMPPGNCTTLVDGVCLPNITLCTGTTCQEQANNINQILNNFLDIVLPILMILLMLSMGCTTDVQKLWGHIRRPWAIIVGFCCQFGIMPLIAFILAKAFNVLPVHAVVIIIMGCCPGGAFSNTVAYWLDSDMDLSISMTTCSTVLAMGMMPLSLLIYTSSWKKSSSSIQIPYKQIGIMLVLIMVPVGAGIYINYRWPELAKKAIKVGSMLGFPLFIIISVVSCILYKNSWNISPSLWIIGIVFPLLGFSIGFLLARVVRQPWKRCRTIALETGVQNANVCGTIIQLSFSQEEQALVFAFPVIYVLSQIFFSLLALGGYQAYKHRCRRNAMETPTPEENEVRTVENGGLQGDGDGNTTVKVTWV